MSGSSDSSIDGPGIPISGSSFRATHAGSRGQDGPSTAAGDSSQASWIVAWFLISVGDWTRVSSSLVCMRRTETVCARDKNPKPIAPAVSTQTGLLLEPPLDLSAYTREKFIEGTSTVGRERSGRRGPIRSFPRRRIPESAPAA